MFIGSNNGFVGDGYVFGGIGRVRGVYDVVEVFGGGRDGFNGVFFVEFDEFVKVENVDVRVGSFEFVYVVLVDLVLVVLDDSLNGWGNG